jgi:outer membrane receptor protein involved in Fe transport
MYTHKQSRLSALILFVLAFQLPVIGTLVIAESQLDEPNSLLEMDLEELMNIPIVVSASRQSQKISELSVPVSVLSAEDIHYSGLTTLPEILQFVPGVEVRRFDRSRYVVGVRGLLSRTSDRTLVLINGRNANDLFYGAPDWFTFPILMEDIERVEVVRGPGGAAWGANASSGVINIITKKPKDVQGYFGSTTFNHFGDSYTHLRWGGKQDKWSWRISAGYEDFEDSDSAGAGKYESGVPILNPLLGFDNYAARDFMRNWRFDTEASYQYSDRTQWSLGVGHTCFESGSYEFVGYNPPRDDRAKYTRVFSRIDHQFNDAQSGYLQWSGNFLDGQFVNTTKKYSNDEYHLEGQFNFKVGERHDIAIGGNLGWLRSNVSRSGDPREAVFADEPFSEQWGGLFLIDRFAVTERLKLEGQIRGDFHTENEEDWATRVSAIYALDNTQDHTFRLSVARAFRMPSIGLRDVTLTALSGFYNVLPISDDLRNETIWSYEAGYTGRLTKELTFRADTYYQRLEDVLGPIIETMGPITNATFDNIDGAKAYGAECELTYENERGKLSGWYAYNSFITDQYAQGLRAHWPARHKAGLTGRLFLPDDWTLNTNYVYNSMIDSYGTSQINPPSFQRLDLTVSKKILDGNGEFMVGVSDVLNEVNDVVLDIGELTGHETPGRTFFARVQLHF